MAIAASFAIVAIAKLIRCYAPIVVGDKKAFNNLAQKLQLKIQF